MLTTPKEIYASLLNDNDRLQMELDRALRGHDRYAEHERELRGRIFDLEVQVQVLRTQLKGERAQRRNDVGFWQVMNEAEGRRRRRWPRKSVNTVD